MRTQLTRRVRRATRAWVTRAMLAAGLGIGLAGCATHPEGFGRALPGRRQTSWQELPAGTVGIITTSSLPLFRVVYPMNRDDAVEEAASRGFWLGGEPYNQGVQSVLSIPLFGLGALGPMAAASVGAQVVTGLRGTSEPRRMGATASIGRVEETVDFQGRLAQELRAHLGPALGRPLVVVPKPVPPIDPGEVRRMASFQAGTLAWLPDNVTGDDYLVGHGVETVLEIRVRDAGLHGRVGVSPDLSLRTEVGTRLIRLGDGVVLARASAAYASPTHKFVRWADRGGRLLQEEFDRGCAQLGRELAKGLMDCFAGPPPGSGTGHLVGSP